MAKKIKLHKLPVKREAKPRHPHRTFHLIVFIVLLVATVIGTIWLSSNTPSKFGVNPLTDASQFDNLSFQYFMNKDYEKAIPLLEFGISAYKGNNPFYLADNYQHIGKCYQELGKYDKAVGFYEKALAIYCHEKKTRPGYAMENEARIDYADVLRHLGQADKAKQVASGEYEPTSTVEPAPNIKANE